MMMIGQSDHRAYAGQKITAKPLKATHGKEQFCGNALQTLAPPHPNALDLLARGYYEYAGVAV